MTKKELAIRHIQESIKNLTEINQWLAIAETDPNAMSNVGILMVDTQNCIEAADRLLTEFDAELRKGG